MAPAPGRIRFGDLRRTTPIDPEFGFDRGQPVDRHYIEGFLERHRADIRGRVLEVADRNYTLRFGSDRVVESDILDIDRSNSLATVVGDLASDKGIAAGPFDCVLLNQTLHLIYDVATATRNLERLLAPGGVALVTVPGTSQVDRGEWRASWFWSFTEHSARRLFEDVFGKGNVTVESHGNVLAAVAFLHGLASSELRPQELDERDSCYPVIIAIRATKARSP